MKLTNIKEKKTKIQNDTRQKIKNKIREKELDTKWVMSWEIWKKIYSIINRNAIDEIYLELYKRSI